MDFNLKIGLKGEAEDVVGSGNTARQFGSGSVEVYATPAMIGLLEHASLAAVDPFLPEGFATVGSSLNVAHLAATPMGLKVRAQAELVEIDGRRLVFRVEAFDAVEKIGTGEHQRFIVSLDKFMTKALDKRV